MISKHISTQIYNEFGFETTFDQKKLIESLSEFICESSEGGIFILNGYAGTGKTTLLGALVRTLKHLKINTVLMAPTGRAAKVLSQHAESQALTIHKKIYRQKKFEGDDSRFDLSPNRHKNTIFIVDEASMLSNVSGENRMFGSGCLLDDLIKYINSGVDCRLILVGDQAQLPPVGLDASPALDPVTMGYYGDVCYGTMTDVVRQESDSGILFNATLVRCMIEAGIQDIPMFRLSLPQIKSVEGHELNECLEDAYSKWGADGVIVITRSNRRANRFNQAIRNHILQREEEVSSGDMLMIVKNNYHYVENDPDTELEFIANGDIARVKRIRRYEELFGFRFADVTLTFPDYEDYELDCKIILDTLHSESPSLSQDQSRSLFFAIEEDYAHITAKSKRYKAIREDAHYNALQVKFAYSVTCHKAQGGQWPCVFVDKMLFGDEEISTDLMRWLYTALTRATEQLYLINFDERFFEE